MRLPKLTDEEAQQVDEILCRCKEEENNHQSNENSQDTSNYYQLSGNEKQRLADLNAALGVSDDSINQKLRPSPRVKFADENPTKTCSQKMMGRKDRSRINCIDRELDKIAFENPNPLTTIRLEYADELNANDYSEFKAKRIVNFAFNFDDEQNTQVG